MKEKNKIVTFIGVIAVLFIGLLLYAQPGKNQSSEVSAKNIPVGAEELSDSHTAGLNSTPVAALSATETFYDFGTISMKDGKVSKIFQVINSTNEDINIPSLSTSCMCTNAYIVKSDGSKKGPFGMPGHGGAVPRANAIVEAGGSLNIEIVYDPNAHGPAGVGLIERSVYLEDESGNIIEFKIKVNVTP
ncbi:MAG TPA: DUF1573 domain-containing protein [Candidatus Paceibacterota bacterium]